MIPLKMLLPPQNSFFEDPAAPLGISFFPRPEFVPDFESEIAAMKLSLQTHPLIGSVVQATQPVQSAVPGGSPVITVATPPVPNAPRGRRSSVGGDRAQAIAAQFETSEPEDEYPESEVEYFETVSGDGDSTSRPVS